MNENVSRLAGKSVEVRGGASASSLQLALESKDLDAVKKQYLDKFQRALDGMTDVIGFVYAINGELNSAEVYNNKNLFRALWPKLLDSAVTEAVTECNNDKSYPQLSAEQVKTFFENAVSGTPKEHMVWKSTRVRTYGTGSSVLFETQDVEAGGVWIHKSFINQEKEGIRVPLDRY